MFLLYNKVSKCLNGIKRWSQRYGGCSRAAIYGADGAGVTIQLLKITHIINNTINVNKVGRHLMHLELFVARESNERDDQIGNLRNTISRHDQAICRLDRLVDSIASRVGD